MYLLPSFHQSNASRTLISPSNEIAHRDMHAVFHSGVDSAKISFPTVSCGTQLSARELEEIEIALIQMVRPT